MNDFIVLMRAKLALNNHKGGWDRLRTKELIELMRREIEELEEAVKNEDYKEAAMECADIANYAMMISDKCLNRRLV